MVRAQGHRGPNGSGVHVVVEHLVVELLHRLQLDAALGDGGKSESDAAREQGLAQFEQRVNALATSARTLDAQWRRLRSECAARPVRGTSGTHEWFGIWLDTRADPDLSPQCLSIRDYLATQGKVMADAMAGASEAARQDGVFPGTIRSIREQYGMDWDGWER